MNKQCNRLSFLNISNINIPAGVTRLPYKYCYKGEDPLALRHSFSTALPIYSFLKSVLLYIYLQALSTALPDLSELRF